MLAIHAATGPKAMAELIGVVGGELQRLAEKGPAPAERPFQGSAEGRAADEPRELVGPGAEQMARQLILYGRLISPKS